MLWDEERLKNKVHKPLIHLFTESFSAEGCLWYAQSGVSFQREEYNWPISKKTLGVAESQTILVHGLALLLRRRSKRMSRGKR